MQRYGPALPSSTTPSPSNSASFVAAALVNPYATHYTHAYRGQTAATTLDGYTLSSAFTARLNQPLAPNRTAEPQRTFNAQYPAHWHQPGNDKCSYPGCTFTGSHKALEIHKMDRHLIYPPGWGKRKQKPDWDADPSLKGFVWYSSSDRCTYILSRKPIPIQGTGLVLDSPEALEAWISERKRRWPTAHRIQEKKQKMDEAIARGQLSPEDSSPHSRKRRRLSESRVRKIGGNYERDRRGDGAARRTISNAQQGKGRNGSKTSTEAYQPSTAFKDTPIPSNSRSEAEPDDDKPEVNSSKRPPTFQEPVHRDTQSNITPSGASESSHHIQKPHIRQPRREPPNPFRSRPALLRNVRFTTCLFVYPNTSCQLLLPEIRVTISNLSQAIRFLVDNDFLCNVEMKAGEAEGDMIRVINGSEVVVS